MSKLFGDNVQWYTLGAIITPFLATLFIGLHVLFADGPHVDQELTVLEVIAGGSTIANGIYGMAHAWLAKRGIQAPPTLTEAVQNVATLAPVVAEGVKP